MDRETPIEPRLPFRSAKTGAAPCFLVKCHGAKGPRELPQTLTGPFSHQSARGANQAAPGTRNGAENNRKPINESARHEICGNFASTRLAGRSRGRMMAVFRFQRRCRSTLRAKSDEDVAPIGSNPAGLSRASGGDRWSSEASEESENNLPDLLDRCAMHPHNRQFSTEGCPSG